MKRVSLPLSSLCLLAVLVALAMGASSGIARASSSAVRHVAQAYPAATAMPGSATSSTTSVRSGVTSSTTTGLTSTTRTGVSVYSAARPAPVVPAGAAVVSQTATVSGTQVVYRSGALYYNVTYSPTGRYTYTVTRAPGTITSTVTSPSTTTVTSPSASAVTTLPATGGAELSAPGAPVLPTILGLTLVALGLTARRLARRFG